MTSTKNKCSFHHLRHISLIFVVLMMVFGAIGCASTQSQQKTSETPSLLEPAESEKTPYYRLEEQAYDVDGDHEELYEDVLE